jgi:peptidoglycan hydrolase-like protein with peptidoglycan-binding domain
MLHFISKILVSLGFAAAALSTTPADTTPGPNLTPNEVSVSLHNKITGLRNEVEKIRLETSLPHARPISIGQRGADITKLQEYLVTVEFLTADSVTGLFGPTTQKAVQEFQKFYELPITGVVDQVTLNKIFEIILIKDNLGVSYFPEETTILDMATSSEAIINDYNTINTRPPTVVDSSGGACPDLPQPVIIYQCPPPGAVTLTVTGTNFTFAPKTLSVTRGAAVTIHYINSTGTHNFVIDALGVKTANLTSGKTADVSFVATTSGSFLYYSSVGTDKASGMTGTITISN